MSEPVPWLARYRSPHPRRSWMDRVIPVDGWSAVSDAASILLVADGGRMAYPMLEDDPAEEERGQADLRPFLAGIEVRGEATLAQLWQWCEFTGWEECDSCQGTGTVPAANNVPCPDCEGKGRFLPAPPRPGLLAGVRIDRNRLAYWLAPELAALDGTAILGTHRGVLCLESARGRWRLLQSPLEPTPQQSDPAPAFHACEEYLPLWLSHRDDRTARLILADWLEDHGDPYADVLRGEIAE